MGRGELADPKDQPIAEGRAIRDDIVARVANLAGQLGSEC